MSKIRKRVGGVSLLVATGVLGLTGCSAMNQNVVDAFSGPEPTFAPVESSEVTPDALTASLRAEMDVTAPWVTDADVSCIVDLVADSELSNIAKKAIATGEIPIADDGYQGLPDGDAVLMRTTSLQAELADCISPLPEPVVELPETGLPDAKAMSAKLDYLVWNGMGKSPDGGACVLAAVEDTDLSEDALRYLMEMELSDWSNATTAMQDALSDDDAEILLSDELGTALGECVTLAQDEIISGGEGR